MFIEDVWLSKVLEFSCYKIVKPSLTISNDDLRLMDFVYVKLKTDELALINHLMDQNFSIIETNIILKSKKIIFFENKQIKLRFASKEDEKELKKIAEEEFHSSRFHVDEKIPNEKANYLKSEWVGSFFKGLRGDWMVVALCGGHICGFLQLMKDNNDIIIDLIAVKKKFQGRGIGKSMISFAFKNCATPKTSFIVGTQLRNLKSIHFYHNIGFCINNSRYTLHYHK